MKRRPGQAPHARAPRPAGQVRIIGGHWRGTRLSVLDRPGLRPSSDRGRETLFNWLQPMLPGARVLDLFAGSGALGLEALSRGAAEAVLVERDPGQAAQLAAAIGRLDRDGRAQLVVGDALHWLQGAADRRFDLVFIDPPFEGDHWASVLQRLPPWLSDDAWLYLESPTPAPVHPGTDWLPHRTMSTRHAHGALYRRAAGMAAATLPGVANPSTGPQPHE
ncbi:MAG: 16S rRNA (guanine(966)-N(2))-methyltransferase RsmD [Pseudoxanthomonas suwonensis]|nr:16S rRNA (guanine(966)-N(2))-methyltransferase RsmD [Pseudoxanthomonas suwonensis]